MIKQVKPIYIALGAIMVLSLAMHFWLAGELNVVEDESAYMMDAWQSSFSVLPFREFGATKGPVFLYALKAWQLITGQTILATRLFPSLLHVASIPLLFLLTLRLSRSKISALLAASFWGLTTTAVSLTTNVIHQPLEFIFIFSGLLILLSDKTKAKYIIGAALLFFLAVLTRATAVAFLPLFLFVLIRQGPKLKRLAIFGGSGLALLTAAAIFIYPFYGWPKTAFFFNADAVLITADQQVAYASSNINSVNQLFIGLTPLWREGLPLAILAISFILLAVRSQTVWLKLSLAAASLTAAYYLAEPIIAAANYSQAKLFYWSSVGLALAAILVARPLKNKVDKRELGILLALVIWISSFLLFYKNWGRVPTPYYILEIIPALAIAASFVVAALLTEIKKTWLKQAWLISTPIVLAVIVGLAWTLPAVPNRQFRGTVSVAANNEVGEKIRELVPDEEQIFTAQPSFAYLGQRQLYGYYTHPGWYLYERRNIVPTEIRRVFFEDPDILLANLKREINWIVVDWRTEDVYFNKGDEATKPYRDWLANNFDIAVAISNPVTQPVIIYKRK